MKALISPRILVCLGAVVLAGCTGAGAGAETDTDTEAGAGTETGAVEPPDPPCTPEFVDPRLAAQISLFNGPLWGVCDEAKCGNFYGIRDFEGIQCVPEIEVVDCVACPIEDLRPLRNVRALTISGARIRTLDALAGFENLTSLSLIDGELEDVDAIFSDAADLPALQELRLTGNRIAAIEGSPNLPDLVNLDLSRNLLTRLPPAVASVSRLDLADNMIAEPPDAQAWPGLIRLTMAGNALVDLSALAGHEWLVDLDLANNRIVDVTPLSGLPALENLDLRDNLITSIAPLVLPSLRAIYLDRNPLVSLDGLSAPMLHDLHVAACKLGDLDTVMAFPLEVLDASDNLLHALPPLGALAQWARVDLAGNAITDLSGLAGLPQVSRLDLSRNPVDLTTMPPGVWADEIAIDSAGLTSLAGIEVAGWQRLSAIDNAITDLSPLAMHSPLEERPSADLAGNPITTLAPLSGVPWGNLGLARTGFQDLSQLVDPTLDVGGLDLRGNGITDASALAGATLPISLDLSDNLLTSFPAAGTGGSRLMLSRNPLAAMGPLPPEVGYFECEGCALTSVEGIFDPSGDLNMLFLSGNPLESVAPLAALKRLVVLKLDEVGSIDFAALALREIPIHFVSLRGNGITEVAPLRDIASDDLDLADNAIVDLSPLGGWSADALHVDLSGNPVDAPLELLLSLCEPLQITLDPFRCEYDDPGS